MIPDVLVVEDERDIRNLIVLPFTVRRLRAKLGAEGARLTAVKGVGYQLIGD